VRFNTWVTTRLAEGWLRATATTFALLLPQPPSNQTEKNTAAKATQLLILRNLIPPASHE
jgi:hypothetical protein